MLHSTPLRTSALQCGGASAKYSFSCRAKGLSVSPRRRIRVSLCLNSSQRSPAEQAHSSTSMAAILATATTTAVGASDTTAAASRLSPSYRGLWLHTTNTGTIGMNKLKGFLLFTSLKCERRKTLTCSVNPGADDSFKKTVEMDRLIDMLKEADTNEHLKIGHPFFEEAPMMALFTQSVFETMESVLSRMNLPYGLLEVCGKLQRLAVENVLAFNEGFWIRLAARTDTCKSDDDKKDYEELALTLMSIVDRLVHKTNEKIEFATDVLESILRPVVDEVEEITWPPRDPESLALMKKELDQRELEGQLDEGFLSEVNAQLRQAKEDGDKPGLQAMLQKVLQFYASKVLSKRSYAQKGNQILKAEKFLESVIQAPEEDWNWLLINGLTLGKGEVSPEEFYAVIKKRIERTLIRTEGGSYQQRILTEYLKGIQARTDEVIEALQGQQQ